MRTLDIFLIDIKKAMGVVFVHFFVSTLVFLMCLFCAFLLSSTSLINQKAYYFLFLYTLPLKKCFWSALAFSCRQVVGSSCLLEGVVEAPAAHLFLLLCSSFYLLLMHEHFHLSISLFSHMDPLSFSVFFISW